jgi:predicted metal-binding membrane protein
MATVRLLVADGDNALAALTHHLHRVLRTTRPACSQDGATPPANPRTPWLIREATMKGKPRNAVLPAAGGTSVPAPPAVVARATPAATVVALTGTLGLAAACWVIAVWQVHGMDMGTATQLGSFGFFMAVWVVMMAAMMLPGAAPAVLKRAQASGGVRAVPLFIGSYLAVWALAGVAVYALDRPHGPAAAAVVVIAAGAYEFTPLKRNFRRRCRDSVRSGLEFGLCCAGSSVALMAMLVALGVMSVPWMSVIAVLILGQKVMPAKAAVDVPLALAITGLGIWIILAPSSVPGLVPPM